MALREISYPSFPGPGRAEPGGPSLWLRTAPPRSYPPLRGPVQADVAIVGAGITGLTAAVFLQRPDRQVVVLEAETLAAGATGRTSAHVTSVTDLRFAKLISRFGLPRAAVFVAATRAAFETMEDLATHSCVGCDWQRVPAYLYTERRHDVDGLGKEAEAATLLGVNAALVRPRDFPFPVEAALLFPEQARFHPVAYLQGLARRFLDAGGRIFGRTRVRVVAEEDRAVRLQSDEGLVLAPRALLATHTPLGFDLTQVEIAPYRSYLVAFRTDDALPDALLWDSEKPYHYLRRVEEDGEPLVLVGGEDEKVGQEKDPGENYRRLEEFARRHFHVREVVARWSAQFYEPADGLPYVGRSARSESVFIATGFSGVGLVQGTLAATVVQNLLEGRGSTVEEMLAPTRIPPLAAAPKFVAENVNVAARFVRDRLAGWENTFYGMGRRDGRLVEKDGRKLAVYRDEQGALHALSPTCTHMGCIVHWNATEQSWDCPCHGGRFSPRGEVLAGPPLAPLRALPLDREGE